MKKAVLAKTESLTPTLAAHAIDVDAVGRFPVESLEALRKAGLLGLLSAKEVGGLGLGFGDAARVVERVARECGSTSMILTMHYAGAAVIEKHGPESVRKEVAAGNLITTLAFSEAGSRSHFWAPVSTARSVPGGAQRDGE
jgi:alkylation response protein AidB-like acyl-CoA dehydrogenase